jgi:hypothetical protein
MIPPFDRSGFAAIPNPHGSGSFVYAKGRKGFIWFVSDGDVIAVSAWAKNVTPDALDLYEVAPGFWARTGLDADSAFVPAKTRPTVNSQTRDKAVGASVY